MRTEPSPSAWLNALLFMAVRPGSVRATCANPWSLADRSAAQSFQSEHVPLEAWPQGGARSRPRRLCSRDPQSFSGAPRSFRAWSCAEFRWARGAFNSVEPLSLVREQVMNCLTATIFLGLPPAYCFTCGFALPAGVNFAPLWARFTDIMYILSCRVP